MTKQRAVRRRAKASSVDKALDVLLLLSQEPRELGIREIARRLAMSPPTVHRLLASFVARDLVQQADGAYKLGWVCVALGRRVLSSTGIPDVGRRFAEELRDKTGETVTVQVRVDNDQVTVVEVEGRHELRWRVGVGRRMRLHAGASGRAILAFLRPEQQEEYIRDGLPSVGPNTVTDATALRRLLAETRQRGYAVSHGEARPGVVGVAAPVFDEHGEVVASISISGPEGRLPADAVARFIPELVVAARGVSHDLGSPDREPAPAEDRSRSRQKFGASA